MGPSSRCWPCKEGVTPQKAAVLAVVAVAAGQWCVGPGGCSTVAAVAVVASAEAAAAAVVMVVVVGCCRQNKEQ